MKSEPVSITLSGWLVDRVKTLIAVENGNMWNYTKLESRVNTLRAHTYDLVMGAICSEIVKNAKHTKIGYVRY